MLSDEVGKGSRVSASSASVLSHPSHTSETHFSLPELPFSIPLPSKLILQDPGQITLL